MMDNNCVFCKIVEGELPSCKVYEDNNTLAFMDIGPIIKGHTLVIPKQHYNDVIATPPSVLQQIIVSAQKIAQAQMAALKADGINIVQANGKAAGQVVPHIHFHVIPRFNNDGHSWNWPPRSYKDSNEMQQFAECIKKEIPL